MLLNVLTVTLGLKIQDVQKRLTGIAFDGQYENLNVADHLRTLLDQKVWLEATWDHGIPTQNVTANK